MTGLGVLFAQVSSSRTYYEVMRLRHMDEWWHWLLLVLVCAIALAAVGTMYVFDSRQLATGKRWLLFGLRFFAFAGLLVFFMDIQKRSERKLVRNSRFAFLIDTSQSMGIVDLDAPDGAKKEARIAQVVRAFSESSWIDELRKKHDVSLYRFDETNLPAEVGSFTQIETDGSDNSEKRPSAETALAEVRAFLRPALGLAALSILAFVLHFVLGRLVRTAEGESWALLVGIFSMIVAIVLVAVSNLRNPTIDARIALGWKEPDVQTPPEAPAAEARTDDAAVDAVSPIELDWAKLLEPAGGSTRLGDAINWLIARERGAPLAGIGVITDGNSNRGLEPMASVALASDAAIPVYPIGVGSELPPTNVRLVDLEAPARVYPGDEFKMTAYVQAYGLAGDVVDLRMVSQAVGESGGEGEEVLEVDLSVELGTDGEVLAVPMQVIPEQPGKRVYRLEIATPDVDLDESDNVITAKVQIVDRQSRVLLLAGGPTREYRFVRNMLHRDKDVVVDVLLQTAVDGVSQEANEILFDLPFEAAKLFEYDAILAFDPDWSRFDRAQVELIEQWVGDKAGGLVCVAGPVHTATWAEDRRAAPHISIVRQLYPVTFSASRIQLGRYASDVAWPLEITKDGESVPFLNLADDDQDATDLWSQFSGVYGYYPIRETKAAARIYARYSDPQVAIDEEQPALVVGQFYGAGRVIFLGSGEFWRLRAVDNAYFERFYTKLIRFASEGRLLRDSTRGVLLVDKDRALRGDAISVRASIVDEQFQPVREPTTKLTMKLPDGTSQEIELLRTDDGREGMYAGRFIASQAGDYQLRLVLPGSGTPVTLEREVRVRLPNLEVERPQRNDQVLRNIAARSNGKYYVGLGAAVSGDGSLSSTVPSKRRETFLPGTPDQEFQRRLMGWLLALICGVLSLEWLLRRLNKLA